MTTYNYEIDANQSAFPSNRDSQTWGLTKRELFAALVLQGMMADPNISKISKSARELAEYAVFSADELIKQLATGA